MESRAALRLFIGANLGWLGRMMYMKSVLCISEPDY